MEASKAFLIILDGWGLGQRPEADAIAQADTPVFDKLWAENPHATLVTYGEEVGLPEGQMGNSEVGHLNIGAGRVVYQSFARINKAIRDGELEKHPILQNALKLARENDKQVHLVGLLSDGGVHSHINHLLTLCDIANDAGNEKVRVHAFTDGRDVAPGSGSTYLATLLAKIKGKPIKLASITGRFYAMDRDTRWERIKVAHDALVNGHGEKTTDPLATMEARYAAGQTDEFIEPIICTDADGEPVGNIEAGDTVIFFNFRTDRPRQITRALHLESFPEQDMHPVANLHYVTMTQYDENFTNLNILYPQEELRKTIGEVVSAAGKTQVRIAETEKYAHVTFFLNGGEESEFPGERRILVDSPRDVETYDEKPEMSAREVTAAIIDDMNANQPDFICLNFANTDMVGHTGSMDAAKASAEVVDTCLGQILETAERHDYQVLIIADHGNSDIMFTEQGDPHTAHTTNLVPVIYVGKDADKVKLNSGKLGDVAPTLLALMGIEVPEEMTGENLIR
ncbi:phosphoglycerate mutase (2,3-diphosphoglycerate-independent) [Lewinellaceae bacterium SD302]|nr:phosphoglycerate mutase (2,3-diphosphoglycerate-independent) [Lewinellaceae bacterium SD302]